jgi:Cu-Zn family superoxide dismutase
MGNNNSSSQSSQSSQSSTHRQKTTPRVQSNIKPINAIATLQSEDVNGYVLFHQCYPTEPVSVIFQINGPPNQIHAIHIHEFGDLRKGCDSLGSHFNPTGDTHGCIFYNMPRHAGDLINNLRFDDQGNFVFQYKDPLISLYPSYNSIIGRSIVIHEKQDDLGLGQGNEKEESLKTGNAGKRICCAVIGLSDNKEHF